MKRIIAIFSIALGLAIPSRAATPVYPAATNAPNVFFQTNTFRTNTTFLADAMMGGTGVFSGNGSGLTNLTAANLVWDGSEYDFNTATLTNIDEILAGVVHASTSLQSDGAGYFGDTTWFTNGLTSLGDVTLSGAGSDLTVGGVTTCSNNVLVQGGYIGVTNGIGSLKIGDGTVATSASLYSVNMYASTGVRVGQNSSYGFYYQNGSRMVCPFNGWIKFTDSSGTTLATNVFAGSFNAENTIAATNGFIVKSNSFANVPVLLPGDNWYFSSNGVPHVMWVDHLNTTNTTRLVP